MLPRCFRRVLWIALLVTEMSVSPAMADDCIASAGGRIYASSSGSHGFLVTSNPANPQIRRGRMFAFSPYSNKEQTVWEAPLIAAPGRVLVSDGDVVVTLDMQCRAGWEHTLVVYGAEGRRIADYSLDDLLTAQEIGERVTKSISSRHWTAGADFDFEMTPSRQLLRIRFPWDRLLTIDLKTGKPSSEAGATPSANQDVDVDSLLSDIRSDVAEEMPTYAVVRSGGRGPGATGDFFLTWQNGNDRLNISCNQHESAEEATRSLRQLRMMISAGVPAPLPRVADEAYYLPVYGWHIYLARRQFVCQVGGPAEESTRRVTAILVRRIDQAVERRVSPAR